jgi:hypothetical protein
MANQAATAVTVASERNFLTDCFSRFFTATGTLNSDSKADGVGDTDTIAVAGVALGDIVLGVSLGVDLAGVTVTGYVSAAGTVSLRVQNESGGIVDLASTTVKVVVGRPNF